MVTELVRDCQHLGGENDDARRAVADFLVLGSRDLNHGLGRRVLDGDLPQDGVAVVGHHNSAHGVHEHLEHGLWAEAGPDDISDGLSGLNVFRLDLATGAALCILAQDQDWTIWSTKHLR